MRADSLGDPGRASMFLFSATQLTHLSSMGFPSVQDQGDREIKEGSSHGFKENDVVKQSPLWSSLRSSGVREPWRTRGW